MQQNKIRIVQQTLPSIYTTCNKVYIEQCNYKALKTINFFVTGDYYGKPIESERTIAVFTVKRRSSPANYTPVIADRKVFAEN